MNAHLESLGALKICISFWDSTLKFLIEFVSLEPLPSRLLKTPPYLINIFSQDTETLVGKSTRPSLALDMILWILLPNRELVEIDFAI